MIKKVEIPIFPLNILPIPNEHVPLHIFEPRYRQLLEDLEAENMSLGIFFSHDLNRDSLCGHVELEAVLKRYPTGESDIVVKCTDTLMMSKFYKEWTPKLYPGGIVSPLNACDNVNISEEFKEKFNDYLKLKKSSEDIDSYDIHDIALELNLDITDRLKYLKLLDIKKRETFLSERLRYKTFMLEQESKVHNNFFLN